MVQSFDKQFVAPSPTSTKTKFANRGWFGKMEASSANNLLKQETGRSHDLLSYRNSALAARARYMIRKPSRWPCRFIPISKQKERSSPSTFRTPIRMPRSAYCTRMTISERTMSEGCVPDLGRKPRRLSPRLPMNFPIRQSTRQVLRTQISAAKADGRPPTSVPGQDRP